MVYDGYELTLDGRDNADDRSVTLRVAAGLEATVDYLSRVLKVYPRIKHIRDPEEFMAKLQYQLEMEELADYISSTPLEAGRWQKYLGVGVVRR